MRFLPDSTLNQGGQPGYPLGDVVGFDGGESEPEPVEGWGLGEIGVVGPFDHHFYAVELCDGDGSDFDDPTSAELVTFTLPRLIAAAGLLVRADNRGKVKIMVSPPLVAGPDEHEELAVGLDQVLSRLEGTR